jgi:hypothetical protein
LFHDASQRREANVRVGIADIEKKNHAAHVSGETA